jgi:ribosomal-protein-alanine N-acetyltransferase
MTTGAPALMTLRRALPADLPAIAAIERVSFSDPWTVEALASTLALRHIRFLVAEEIGPCAPSGSAAGAGAGALLGYVVALIAGDEGEIADLAVAPSARRRGVGGALLDRVVRDAAESEVQALYLEVRESNAGAIALYRSRGFGAVGRRRGYYRHPSEDALVLRREIAPT